MPLGPSLLHGGKKPLLWLAFVSCFTACLHAQEVKPRYDIADTLRAVLLGEVRVALSHYSLEPERIRITGDSTVLRYIPNELTTREEPNIVSLSHLLYKRDSVAAAGSLSVSFDGTIVFEDPNRPASSFSISKIFDDKTTIDPGAKPFAEESTFWSSFLQPAAVAVGAAAIVTLFFLVHF
jgi:hypothetical protein